MSGHCAYRTTITDGLLVRFQNRLPKNRFATIICPSFGGIAQLVERLVRNEKVRGSNPLTSSLRSHRRGERGLSRRSLGEGGPLFVFTAPTQRATTRQAKIMVKFFYVYILQSQLDPAAILYRHTDNLRNRFQAHNNGRAAHTKKWNPGA